MRQSYFYTALSLVSASKARTLVCIHPHPHAFAADIHKFKNCWTKTALFSAGAYIAVNLCYQWLQLLYRSCSQLRYRLISFFIIIALIALPVLKGNEQKDSGEQSCCSLLFHYFPPFPRYDHFLDRYPSPRSICNTRECLNVGAWIWSFCRSVRRVFGIQRHSTKCIFIHPAPNPSLMLEKINTMPIFAVEALLSRC